MKSRCLLVLLCAAGAISAGAATRDAPLLPPYLHGVGIDQNLNAQVPLDTQFLDESGRTVRLGDLLDGRPAVLALVYYTCPMLCDQIMRGVVNALRPLSLRPGKDFEVIAISINPAEGPAQAAAKRHEYVTLYSRHATGAGWHFLTGTERNIHAVADAVGYHYRYDPKTKMFFHAAGIMVLTPDGKAARYFYGAEFVPSDLNLGLVDASHGRIGSLADKILLYCCKYDPTTGKYTATVLGIMKLTAGAFLALLIAGLAFFWRDELPFGRHRRAREQHT